jgi:chaperonin cofactor prefoldin
MEEIKMLLEELKKEKEKVDNEIILINDRMMFLQKEINQLAMELQQKIGLANGLNVIIKKHEGHEEKPKENKKEKE